MKTKPENVLCKAIADGTAKPDSTYNTWEIETGLSGFARIIIKSAADCIGDSRDLCYLCGAIDDGLTCSFTQLMDDELRRSEHREDGFYRHQEIPEDMIFKAAEKLIQSGALKYKDVALSILAAFNLNTAAIIRLAQGE